ncbi:E3 ubiquitin-protein ligase E3D [Mactra antiquata]
MLHEVRTITPHDLTHRAFILKRGMETIKRNQRVPRFHATFCCVSNTLNCVFEFMCLKRAINVTVEPHEIVVNIGHRKWHLTFSDIILQTETCRGLKWHPTNELQFSIKGQPTESSKTDISLQQKCSRQNDIVELIQKLQNKWYCGNCHQKILADWSIFNRVLPLPSENWSDYADMWFCHNHGNQDSSSDKQRKLLPKTRECFVGETFVLVAGQHVQDSSIKVKKRGSIVCRRCSIQLGVVETENKTESVYKFYQHAILIKDLEFEDLIQLQRTVSPSERLDNFFNQLLQEQSNTYTSYRFIIESKPLDDTEQLSTCLLWLLDSNIEMYTSDYNTDTILTGYSICKVMFKCQLSTSNKTRNPDYVTKSLISLWRKDNTVHGFTLPHPLFLQLINRLIEHCKILPVSQRYLNGFHVSFLNTSPVS